MHNLQYQKIFLRYKFLDGEWNLQDSGKPSNSGRNLGDQTFRYCGVLLYSKASQKIFSYQIKIKPVTLMYQYFFSITVQTSTFKCKEQIPF